MVYKNKCKTGKNKTSSENHFLFCAITVQLTDVSLLKPGSCVSNNSPSTSTTICSVSIVFLNEVEHKWSYLVVETS